MNRCPKCRKYHEGPNKTCTSCLDYKRRIFKANYTKWVTLGLCPWCHINPPRKEGGVYCEECIQKMKTLTPYNRNRNRKPSSPGSSKTCLEEPLKETQTLFADRCSQSR